MTHDTRPNGVDRLLDGLPAVLMAPSLDASLARALALVHAGSAATAAALFLADGNQPLREIWSPDSPDLKAELRPRLKVVALDAVRRGGMHLAASDESHGGLSTRTLLLAGESGPLGAICLAWPPAVRPIDARADRWITATGAFLAHVVLQRREIAKLKVQADRDRRWFKTLDEQLRVLDRERQKFAAVVNQTDTLVFVTDAARTVQWNNRAMAVLFPPERNGGSWAGRSCSQVCGRLGRELRDDDCCECPVRLALERNESIHQELRVQIESAPAILYLTALPLQAPDGRPNEVIVLIQDLTGLEMLRQELAMVTEEQRVERALHESEARKAAMVEAALDAIVSIDHAGRIVEFNPAAEKIFGHRREDALGLDMAQLIIPPGLREGHRRGMERYFAGGEGPVIGRRIEIRALRADGSEFPVELTVARISSSGPPVFTGFMRDITERKRAEEALRSAEQRLRTVVAAAPIVLFAVDRDGVFTVSEGKGLARLGLAAGEVVGRSAHEMYRDHPQILANIARGLEGEEFTAAVDVGPLSFETWHSPIRDPAGAVVGLIGVATDITERRQLELELQHAQKMEAVGRLAGGVAHEFNNLLTVIHGHCEVAQGKLGPGEPLQRSIEEIRKAGARGALLTRQLLAFSRKDVPALTVLDPGVVVRELESMLRPLLGETVQVVIRVAPGAHRIHADRGQIDQVLMNLAVNSRDAMSHGGRITIEIGSLEVGPDDAHQAYDVPPGRYVSLFVQDDGHGMDPETLTHLFEPFFTTKEQGRGTGLGMSVVYGIVRQAGGDIRVESALGRGTMVRIVFPLHVTPEAGEPAGTSREGPEASRATLGPGSRSEAGARETILLTEDEPAVRELAREMLKIFGFAVLEASCGDEALRIAGSHPGPIAVAVTDIVMPGMNGVELARRLRKLRPEIKVLYVSGYTKDALPELEASEQGTAFLGKPYTMEALRERIDGLTRGSSHAR